MVLPDNISMGPQRVKSSTCTTTTLKTRLDPSKHPQLLPHPPSSSSVPYTYPLPATMFTPKKSTRFTPYNKVNFSTARSPISTSPANGPGGLSPVSSPISRFPVANSSPFTTPARRRNYPAPLISPKTPRSQRGRVPAQTQPRKERSFHALERPAAPTTPPADDISSVSELSSKVYAAAAKSKAPTTPEAEIFLAQLQKLDEMRAVTMRFMNSNISPPDESPVPNLATPSKARKNSRPAKIKANDSLDFSSIQKREAHFASQRKKLREEAIKEEEQREPDHPTAGSSNEQTDLSDSATKLKRKQQNGKADETPQPATSASEQDALMQEEDVGGLPIQAQQTSNQRDEEEVTGLRAEQEVARLRAEQEAAVRRQQEELEHQERLSRAQAEAAREQEEEARRLAAENEIRRAAEEEVRRRAMEDALRKAEEEAQRIAQEEVVRKAEAHARWRLQEQKEERERLERLAWEQAQEEARVQAEKARDEAEHARRVAEQIAEQARFEAEQAHLLAEQQARLYAEQQARFLAEQEARRQAEREAELRAYERAQALAAEEARLRAVAEAVAQMQTELNARAQAAFGEGASWHNPHEYYEFKRFQEQRQQQQGQEQQPPHPHPQQHQQQPQQPQEQHHQEQHQPSSEHQHPHEQPFFERQRRPYGLRRYDSDIPMRDPSLADINMEEPPRSPSPEPMPSPPPPPPPPPAPLTNRDRMKAYHAKWATSKDLWGLPIGFQQIPWPVFYDVKKPEDITFDRLTEFYTSRLCSTIMTHKQTAKNEKLRWHPDKFYGRLFGMIDEGEKPMIETGVNEVFRFLHEVLKDL